MRTLRMRTHAHRRSSPVRPGRLGAHRSLHEPLSGEVPLVAAPTSGIVTRTGRPRATRIWKPLKIPGSGPPACVPRNPPSEIATGGRTNATSVVDDGCPLGPVGRRATALPAPLWQHRLQPFLLHLLRRRSTRGAAVRLEHSFPRFAASAEVLIFKPLRRDSTARASPWVRPGNSRRTQRRRRIDPGSPSAPTPDPGRNSTQPAEHRLRRKQGSSRPRIWGTAAKIPRSKAARPSSNGSDERDLDRFRALTRTSMCGWLTTVSPVRSVSIGVHSFSGSCDRLAWASLSASHVLLLRRRSFPAPIR